MSGPAVYSPHANLGFVHLGPSAPPLLGQGYNVMASRWRVMGHTWARNPASLSWKPDSAKHTPGSLPTAGGRATQTQPFPGFSAKMILSWCLFKTLTYLQSPSRLTASFSSSLKLNQPRCKIMISLRLSQYILIRYDYIQYMQYIIQYIHTHKSYKCAARNLHTYIMFELGFERRLLTLVLTKTAFIL